MGWASDFDTAGTERVWHMAWFLNTLYAFADRDGVWRRDGPGAWTHVQAATNPGAGEGCYWPEDGALYCGTEFTDIRRSTDGAAWALDLDMNVAFGISGRVYGIGAWGSYLYVMAYNAAGPGHCYFLRRDLAGVWAYLHDENGNGANTQGCIGFGATGFYYPYWSRPTAALGYLARWTGTAWEADPQFTYEPRQGEFTMFNNRLYMTGSTMLDPANRSRAGYWRRSLTSLGWAFLPLSGANDSTWIARPAHEGGDGRLYGLARNGTWTVVYRLNDAETVFETVVAVPGLNCDGLGVLADGTIYLASDDSGTTEFYIFVPDYDLTPSGQGLLPQAIDCDGDGNQLYLALYDTATAQPMLISVPVPLNGALSMGSDMFSPGAGDAINVKCTDVGNELAVSGWFGLDEQVEATTDAGLNWAYTDPAAWDNNRAQPLIVAPLTTDEVMVALDALQEIHETFDIGVNWVQRNAAVGYSPGAMVRLVNGTEMIIGDDAANQIDYSPNNGVSTADITGAFGGNVAALEIT